MSNSAIVVALHICPGHRKPMIPVQALETIAEKGIQGDMHALEHSTRHVLLIEQETLLALNLQAGMVKENITTAGIALMSLKRGQDVRLGGALLRITNECMPCTRLEEIRPGLQELIRGKRGMLARVVHGGMIRVGDAIHVV